MEAKPEVYHVQDLQLPMCCFWLDRLQSCSACPCFLQPSPGFQCSIAWWTIVQTCDPSGSLGFAQIQVDFLSIRSFFINHNFDFKKWTRFDWNWNILDPDLYSSCRLYVLRSVRQKRLTKVIKTWMIVKWIIMPFLLRTYELILGIACIVEVVYGLTVIGAGIETVNNKDDNAQGITQVQPARRRKHPNTISYAW